MNAADKRISALIAAAVGIAAAALILFSHSVETILADEERGIAVGLSDGTVICCDFNGNTTAEFLPEKNADLISFDGSVIVYLPKSGTLAEYSHDGTLISASPIDSDNQPENSQNQLRAEFSRGYAERRMVMGYETVAVNVDGNEFRLLDNPTRYAAKLAIALGCGAALAFMLYSFLGNIVGAFGKEQ